MAQTVPDLPQGRTVPSAGPTEGSPYAVDYRPRSPKEYAPGIALVGCGGIARHHLQAYRAAGFRVVALCDVNPKAAQQRRDTFYPEAIATTHVDEAIAQPGVEVVDITTHPEVRPPLIEAALRAGKHVLSQKPFVTDLDEGRRLADLADACGVRLAVNQNARWAPHFAYIRGAVRGGLVGDLTAAHFAVHWDHSWTKGTPFEEVRHLILFDYAIHWFDLLSCLTFPHEPRRIHASFTRSRTQKPKAALLAQAMVEYDGAQASLVFDGHSPGGQWATALVVGDRAIVRSHGYGDNNHEVTFTTTDGSWQPRLTGRWFDDGFHGTMGELLCAIEEGREPLNNARDNLRGLALSFAAIQSAETGQPVTPGSVTKLPQTP